MLSYIIRRLLLIFPTLLGITVVVFTVMSVAPGGAGMDLARGGEGMRPEERRAREEYLKKRYALDRPALVRYFRWLNQVSPLGLPTDASGVPHWGSPRLKWPDLGYSYRYNRPVSELIQEALPVTLLLNAMAIPLVYVIAIFSGIMAARNRGKFVDIALGTLFLALWSVPTIWAGVLLQGFFTSDTYWRLFPTATLHDLQADSMAFLPTGGTGGFQRGWLLDTLWHLVLPVVCLSYGGFAFLSKLARGAVLEVISSDYVRTARAKGLSERTVLYVHVLRNSLIPLITFAAHLLPALIGGAVVVETIFAIPGMGRLGVEAVQLRDPEVVMAVTLVAGTLGLFSVLLADIGYAIADPRVSYE